MATSFSVSLHNAGDERSKYSAHLKAMQAPEVIAEFLSYLDYTEETNSGRVFHPIQLSSVRCLMNEPLSMVINRMKEVSSLLTKENI